MRTPALRLLTVATLAVLPASVLASCADAPAGSGSSGTATSSGATGTASAGSGDISKVTVTPGDTPSVTLPSKPFRVADATSKVVKEGTGEAIGDRAWLDVHYTAFSGADGTSFQTSGAGKTANLRLGEKDSTPESFDKALKGQKVGAQVLMAMPAAKILNDQQLPKGMSLDDSVLYLVDIVDQRPVLDAAKGTAVPPKDGLPTITVPDDAKQPATITVPSATPIKETVVQPLITGTGKKVEKGQTIRVRYTGATWRDPGKPFDYSGKQDPPWVEFPIGAGKLIKAWDNLIPGQTVGSRLEIVVQPADGYGAQGGAGGAIKGDDVLIFILDILDATR